MPWCHDYDGHCAWDESVKNDDWDIVEWSYTPNQETVTTNRDRNVF
jgi:hypothetical protein